MQNTSTSQSDSDAQTHKSPNVGAVPDPFEKDEEFARFMEDFGNLGKEWGLNSLSKTSKDLLTRAQQIELLSLNPSRVDVKMVGSEWTYQKVDGPFHGYRVLGTTKVANDTQQTLIKAIDCAIAKTGFWYEAICFEPRHGIRAAADGKIIDMVICFQCHRIDVYIDGKIEEHVSTTSSPKKFLSHLLTVAKVPLDGPAEKQ
jgi:hypothetical protein